MPENILLIAFVALPLLWAVLMARFFRATSWRSGLPKAIELAVGNGLVLLLLVSTGLLGGEVYYRFIYDTTDGAALNTTTVQWFERHYRYNNVHVRDNIDYRVERSERPRVIVLGDSFTAGHGIADVENRFVNRIRAARGDLEIVLKAQNGRNTEENLQGVQDMLDAGYRFDTLMLVYVPNKLDDLMPDWQEIVRRERDAYQPGFLFRHSYFLNTLYANGYRRAETELARYDEFALRAYSGPPWEIERERLTRLKQLAEAGDAQFMVVTFPFLRTLGPGNPYLPVHRQIAGLWRDLGVPHLDLLPVFNTLPRGDLVVNRYDNHPNIAAHTMAAAEILRFLDRNPPTAHRP